MSIKIRAKKNKKKKKQGLETFLCREIAIPTAEMIVAPGSPKKRVWSSVVFSKSHTPIRFTQNVRGRRRVFSLAEKASGA